MTAACFDTSVLVPYYTPEVHSALAERRLVRTETRHISALCRVELAAALMRKVRKQALSETLADSVLEQFEQHLSAGFFHVVPLSSQHLEAAGRHILAAGPRHVLRTLDALHLAVASLGGWNLITADARQAAAAEAVGLPVTLLKV